MPRIFKGRGIMDGEVEGEALVSHQTLRFVGGVDADTGIVYQKGHDLEGKKITGKILIFPEAKGSVGTSSVVFHMGKVGTAPAAMITYRPDPPLIFGAILGEVPMLSTEGEQWGNEIKTGDKLQLDGKTGVVKLLD
ncbi:MAG: aconitase X swivel domain-containing protein [Candidatus Ranarchaeia archaeon]